MKTITALMAGLWLVAGALPARVAAQEYQASQAGLVQRAGRFLMREPLSKAAELHADVVYVSMAGDSGDYRLSAKLGVAAPLWGDALALDASFSDEYTNSRGALVWRNDTLLKASLSLRFGRRS